MQRTALAPFLLAPFLLAPGLLVLAAFAPLRLGAQETPRAAASEVPAPRTVILVRHAEKDAHAPDPRDPGLSAEGQQRARELAQLLAPAGATQLFASEFHRTQDTLAPLAQRAGASVEVVPAGAPDALLARLDALPPGAVAVVAGHSNTLPALAERLGVHLAGLTDTPRGAMLDDAAYDRLFVVTRPAAGPPSLLELSYGAASGATSSSGR